MDLKHSISVLLMMVVFLMSFAGCGGILPTQRETALDQNWGRAYETAKYYQIINPEPMEPEEPLTGLDAEAAKQNMGKYRESFEKETPPPVYYLNMGIGQ